MAEVNVSESRLILHLHWTLTERTQMQTVMVISFSSTITNTDRAVLKIENVSSFSPINMDRKLTTSLYDVLSMHATYAPFIVVYAATDNVCLCVTLDDMGPRRSQWQWGYMTDCGVVPVPEEPVYGHVWSDSTRDWILHATPDDGTGPPPPPRQRGGRFRG